jgi:hypothetical protein
VPETQAAKQDTGPGLDPFHPPTPRPAGA